MAVEFLERSLTHSTLAGWSQTNLIRVQAFAVLDRVPVAVAADRLQLPPVATPEVAVGSDSAIKMRR